MVHQRRKLVKIYKNVHSWKWTVAVEVCVDEDKKNKVHKELHILKKIFYDSTSILQMKGERWEEEEVVYTVVYVNLGYFLQPNAFKIFPQPLAYSLVSVLCYCQSRFDWKVWIIDLPLAIVHKFAVGSVYSLYCI